jgi:putative PIN family toxin of toxin-antitoxin system
VRVFFDTNVLVSAFVSRGLCTDLLKIVLGEHDLLVSNLVVEEFEHVLRDKLGVPKNILENALGIFAHVEVVPNGPEFEKNDDTILAAAIDCEADIFVTGDHELLTVAKRFPIPAVSPRKFMELLRVPGDSYPIPPDGDGDPRVSEQIPGTVREMAFEFALSIINLCKTLEEGRGGVLARQLLRAGASIGANLEEGGTAESRREYQRRMAGALRQGYETKYWLRLLSESEIAPETDFEPYLETCLELIRLLVVARAERG